MNLAVFFHILGHNITPIFTLVALGFLVSKRFNLDLYSLSKLTFYLFSPAFIFVNLYTTTLNLSMLKVLFCAILLLIIHDAVGRIIAKIRNYDIGLENAFKNSIMFNNSGNIGLSLVMLVFSGAPFVIDGKTPYLSEAIAAQIVILVFQNISSNTLGFYNAGRSHFKAKDSILQVLSMPSVYVIPTAFILKGIDFNLTETIIWPVLDYLKNGMVPIVLLTLGVQLSKTKFNFTSHDVHISVFTKLFIGPALAVACIHLFGFNGVVAQTVFIAYSVPTAINTALIAVECKSCPDFASQAVMVSTIFSAITLTIAIYAARIMFPV
ncbi:MAG: Auxin Efflux Carrier [Firmicutes bacterium]|nr:Auxin Efflux Carrier [Bacillota bacterium]